ncbi:MAG: 5'-3' exonuclease H3TH domain-containing protein, partial [Candidatus Sulfotelmatobacter sp.]
MPPRTKSPQPDSAPAPAAEARIFLIDTMSFIFRAYHAMARQRSMSTKSGLPTAAVYVFVNMLRKLRDDFSPNYLAAVFDVAAPTFRDTQAEAITTIRKFDIKTQTFTEVEYKGYKANRAAMPEDLAQQIPYIRRALEAYRIPILELAGFEADDVIGTLARKAAAAKHPVYVVSSDKDMMQLVNDDVHILNPPKDNLICDAAKVEEILGVPPERVVDIMALRGDSVDNIPGAPGIGEKGSVEIIKRFGSVEQALDRANEVEKKTYRESLQNNRDIILFSKSMATIDTNVPVELNVEAMRAGQPDLDLLRQLFTELEFTSLLKELLPDVQVTESHYSEAQSAADVDSVLNFITREGSLAIAVELEQAESISETEEEAVEEEPQSGMLALTDDSSPITAPEAAARRVAISAAAGFATIVKLDAASAAAKLRTILTDSTPKAIHDYKAAIHALALSGISLQGVEHDPMLYSYLLDPTYSS